MTTIYKFITLPILLFFLSVLASNESLASNSELRTDGRVWTSPVMCVAINIYWEAKDQPLAGQIAVAQATVNRANNDRFPSDICEVIYQSESVSEDGEELPKRTCEFSWTCDGIPDEISDDINDEDAFVLSLKVARVVIDGKTPDLIDNATHYHRVDETPTWSYYYQRTIRIEDLIFYKKGR